MRMDELCAENIWKTTFPPHISPKCPWESLCILLGSSLSQTQLINQFWEAGSGVSEGLSCAPAMESRILGSCLYLFEQNLESWWEERGGGGLFFSLAPAGITWSEPGSQGKGKTAASPSKEEKYQERQNSGYPPLSSGQELPQSHFQIFSFLRCQIALAPLPFRQQSLDYPFFAFFLPKSDHYPPFSPKCSHLQL